MRTDDTSPRPAARYGPNHELVQKLVMERARNMTADQLLDFYEIGRTVHEDYAAAGSPIKGLSTDQAGKVAQQVAQASGLAPARKAAFDDAVAAAIDGGSAYEDYPEAGQEDDYAWAAAAHAATALVVLDVIPESAFRDLYGAWAQVFGWRLS